MAIAGKEGKVKIGSAAVAEMASWSLDLGADDIDTTNFDSEGWKEFLAGLKDWSGSFEGNLDPEDTAGQGALITAWLNGSEVSLELVVNSSMTFSGKALVKLSIEMPVDDKGSFSCDFQGSGPLTI